MKFIFKLFFIFLAINAFAGNIPSNNVAEYKITIKKLEVYNSTIGKWIVLADIPTNVDIASANVGQEVGAMISKDAAMMYGTYTKARVTIGNIFTIKACTATPSCTNGNTVSGHPEAALGLTTITTLNNAQSTTITVDFTDSTLQSNLAAHNAKAVGSDLQIVMNFSSPITITQKSSSPNINLSFNLNNVFTSQTLGNDVDNDGNDDDSIIIDFPEVNIALY
jgi:hypothetical protein